MSEAPKTIWLSLQPDYWENNIGTVFTLKNGSHDIAYRRADLPLTTDQLLADPRVEAIVLEAYKEGFASGVCSEVGGLTTKECFAIDWKRSKTLAKLKEPKP
jgi:hypothetical protein